MDLSSVVLVAGALVVGAPLVVAWRRPEDERRALLVVLAVALGVRLLAVAVLESTGAWHITGRGATTPDEATIDIAARLLAGGDPRSPVVLGGSTYTSWLLVTAAVYDLVWDSLIAVKLLNAMIGTVLVVPVYAIARSLGPPRAARLAGWSLALFPPAVVWSALALRDPLIALLVTGLAALALTAARSDGIGWLSWVATAVAALVVLAFTRSYMVPLLGAVVLAASALGGGDRARGLHPARWWAAVTAVGAALAIVAVVPTGDDIVEATVGLVAEPAANVYNPLSDCRPPTCDVVADPRAARIGEATLLGDEIVTPPGGDDEAEVDRGGDGTQAGGEVAPGTTADLERSLQSVGEKGVVRAGLIAVLAGRPVWRTDEFTLLLQPGVVVWWLALPLMVHASVMLVRQRRWDAVVATTGVVAAVVVFLAVTGQFLRHHFMIEPIGLALAAVSASALLGDGGRSTGRWTRRLVAGGVALMGVAAAVSVAASLLP